MKFIWNRIKLFVYFIGLFTFGWVIGPLLSSSIPKLEGSEAVIIYSILGILLTAVTVDAWIDLPSNNAPTSKR